MYGVGSVINPNIDNFIKWLYCGFLKSINKMMSWWLKFLNWKSSPIQTNKPINKMMNITDKFLPPFCYAGRGLKPAGIVVHHFSCMNVDPEKQFDIDSCYNLMLDLNLPKDKRHYYLKGSRHMEGRAYASAHAFIDRDGGIFKIIPFDKQAYHAGKSRLNGRDNCNRWTLGMELIGTASSGFTDAQYEALAALCAQQMVTHGFTLEAVKGHDTVRFNYYGEEKGRPRKYDPSGSYRGDGDNFDWKKLYSLIDDLNS